MRDHQIFYVVPKQKDKFYYALYSLSGSGLDHLKAIVGPDEIESIWQVSEPTEKRGMYFNIGHGPINNLAEVEFLWTPVYTLAWAPEQETITRCQEAAYSLACINDQRARDARITVIEITRELERKVASLRP